MQGINLIQNFGILPLAAGFAGTVCKRLGLFIVVGYLVDLLGADNGQVTGWRTGFSWGELQLAPRAAVQVVGIQESDRRIINSVAEGRLNEGGDLLIFGRRPNIREFSPWLSTARD
jgi:hypothetical protein